MTTPHEEGDPSSRILILAEAPAKTEMRLGRPLVGPSGQVFSDCLRVEGIARNQCYILNLWPFMVHKEKRGNKEYFYPHGSPRMPDDLLWQTGKGFTEAGLEAAGATFERIRQSGANVIVTFGQQALDAATGKSKAIMKWRGSILPGLDRVGGKKVVPTVHPAATLHGTYLWRYLIMNDLRKAKAESLSAELKLPVRSIHIYPTLGDVREYIATCKSYGHVATDLEVINHHVHCFSLAFCDHHAMTVPLVNQGNEPYWDEDEEAQLWRMYADLMENPAVDKINQNLIGFDAPFLFIRNQILTRGFLGDTMIAQHIMYPEFPKGLDFITSIHTREPYYKDEGKMWKGFGGDIEEFWRYCGKDACVAFEAWEHLVEEMTAGDFWPTYNMTARMANPLMFMAARGLRVNLEALDEMLNGEDGIKKRIAEKEEELEAVAEWPFNPASHTQCKKYFYETKGCYTYLNADGKPSTDDKALSRIFRRYNLPEAKLVQEIRSLKKLKSTYLDVQLDTDHRLRCSWNPRGTWTGRLSSSATVFGTGMNLQNLDPRFKDFIEADQ